MNSLRVLGTLFLFAALAMFKSSGADLNTKWFLVWSDEFNGAAGTRPDSGKWEYDLGATGWGNHELEEYTDKPENVSMDGLGHLAIRAIRSVSGSVSSARLKTIGRLEIKYGMIKARIKVPEGQGIWPAFWMLGTDISEVGWPHCGEIDIMEHIGKEPAIIHGTLHGPGYSGSRGISFPISLKGDAPFNKTFHVFGLKWTPASISLSLDGSLTQISLGSHCQQGRCGCSTNPSFCY